MARRLSRERLFEINKVGDSLGTDNNGAGSPGAANYSKIREGRLIISEFTIDLAPAAGVEHSPGTVDLILGVSSSATGLKAGHPRSNLLLIDTLTHGVVTDVELICVETPAGGITDVNLAVVNAGNLDAEAGFSGSVDATIINAGAQSAPMSTAADLAGTTIDDKYLVLSRGAATNGVKGTYSAGKFVIRTFGYVAPDDA
mgnify:CR=1 FL=1